MNRIKLSGIYKIQHSSGYYYIGMSKCVFSRFSGHYTDIRKCRHSSPAFMSLWLNSTPSEWIFQILEYTSITEFKKVSGLKGKALSLGFGRHLRILEKRHMSEHSVNWALNKDRKHFAQ
jgi:hypothetical protein